MKLNWNFPRGRESQCKTKNLLCGEYGYFLELHILKCFVKAFFKFPNLSAWTADKMDRVSFNEMSAKIVQEVRCFKITPN